MVVIIGGDYRWWCWWCVTVSGDEWQWMDGWIEKREREERRDRGHDTIGLT